MKKETLKTTKEALADSAEAKAVQSVAEANAITAHTNYIQTQGKKIIVATAATSLLYHELICYIRKNSVPPRLVSEEMQQLGFVKARSSEVNRIANASDEVFSQYESKMIGFKAAIAMARQDPATKDMVATPAAKLLQEQGTLNATDVEAALEPENETEGGDKKAAPDSVKMERAAKAIFKLASRNKVWKETDEDGILVTWKLVLTKVKPNDPENATLRAERARVDANRKEQEKVKHNLPPCFQN